MPADLEQLWRQARARSAEETAEFYRVNLRRREQALHGEQLEPKWQPAPESLPVRPGPVRALEERACLDGRILERMSDGTIREKRRG